MAETYYLVGHQASYINGLFVFGLGAVSTVIGSAKAKKFVLKKVDLGFCLVGAFLYWSPLPIPYLAMWGLLAIVAILGNRMDEALGTRWSLPKSIAVASGTAIGSMALLAWAESALGDFISLENDRLEYVSHGESGRRERTKLELSAITDPSVLYRGGSTMWSLRMGDRLGPYPRTGEIYWGPGGIVTGDEVGRRIAKWSGVKPEIRQREE